MVYAYKKSRFSLSRHSLIRWFLFFFALLIFSLHAVTKTLNELHWKAYINISIILTCVIFCHAISHCHLYMDKLHSFYRLLHTFLHRKRILVHNFLGLYVPLGSLGLFHIVSLSFWHFFSRIFLLFFLFSWVEKYCMNM